jgi:hypothetical protein
MQHWQSPGPQPPGQRYGQAQKALAGAGTTLKIVQIAVGGLGALLALGGIVMLVTGGFSTGVSLLVTGAVMVVTALVVIPKHAGMLGAASAQVNALAYKDQLAATGLPAQGRLLYIQQTGRMVNFNPEVAATVEVHHPQHGVYQAQTNVVVPQMSIPQFQPGASLQLRVNPQNPHDIAVVV